MKAREEILDEISSVMVLNKETKGKCNLILSDAKSFIMREQKELQDQLDKEYERGMNDAWNIAREIHSDYDEFTDIFGDKATIGEVIRNNTPLYVKEKIISYREEKRKEICIGDIIKLSEDGTKAVVLNKEDYDGHWTVLTYRGYIETWHEDRFFKTKEHIDINNVLLEKLQPTEKDDGDAND